MQEKTLGIASHAVAPRATGPPGQTFLGLWGDRSRTRSCGLSWLRPMDSHWWPQRWPLAPPQNTRGGGGILPKGLHLPGESTNRIPALGPSKGVRLFEGCQLYSRIGLEHAKECFHTPTIPAGASRLSFPAAFGNHIACGAGLT